MCPNEKEKSAYTYLHTPPSTA